MKEKYILVNVCDWIKSADITYNKCFEPLPWMITVVASGRIDRYNYRTPLKAKRYFQREYKNGIWKKETDIKEKQQ